VAGIVLTALLTPADMGYMNGIALTVLL